MGLLPSGRRCWSTFYSNSFWNHGLLLFASIFAGPPHPIFLGGMGVVRVLELLLAKKELLLQDDILL
jgi:hypothetical protein